VGFSGYEHLFEGFLHGKRFEKLWYSGVHLCCSCYVPHPRTTYIVMELVSEKSARKMRL
jgi:hypothetical protein